jgi:hypothetical protein
MARRAGLDLPQAVTFVPWRGAEPEHASRAVDSGRLRVGISPNIDLDQADSALYRVNCRQTDSHSKSAEPVFAEKYHRGSSTGSGIGTVRQASRKQSIGTG